MAKKEESKETTETKETKKPAAKAVRPKARPKSKKADPKKEKKVTQIEKPGEPKPLHGRKFRAAQERVKEQQYTLEEALKLIPKTTTAKFEETVELHVRVENEARGNLKFPNETGKKVRVAVMNETLGADIKKGKIEFDVLLATPEQMPGLAKLAPTLGPKGLMPNPKSGTVTNEIEKVKKEIEGGQIEWRTDQGNNVHLMVGKAKQSTKELQTNVETALAALKPYHIKAIALATSMGPGIKVTVPEEFKFV